MNKDSRISLLKSNNFISLRKDCFVDTLNKKRNNYLENKSKIINNANLNIIEIKEQFIQIFTFEVENLSIALEYGDKTSVIIRLNSIKTNLNNYLSIENFDIEIFYKTSLVQKIMDIINTQSMQINEIKISCYFILSNFATGTNDQNLYMIKTYPVLKYIENEILNNNLKIFISILWFMSNLIASNQEVLIKYTSKELLQKIFEKIYRLISTKEIADTGIWMILNILKVEPDDFDIDVIL